MPRESVFRRLTKYRESELADPKENSLTEAFAVVLDEVDGLAMELCLSWLDSRDGEPGRGEGCVNNADNEGVLMALQGMDRASASLSCETQVAVPSARVDLELRFRGADDAETIIRVEIKIEHTPTNDQLEKYRQKDVAVVLLAPATGLLGWTDDPTVADQIPAQVARRSWQTTALQIRTFRRTKSLTGIEDWLIDEFLKLLNERHLMAPEAIGPQHIIAMTNHAEAEEALRQLLSEARGWIKADGRWMEGMTWPEGNNPKPYGQWVHYAHRDGNGQAEWDEGVWFEFKASTDPSLPAESTGDLHFLAGISVGGKTTRFGGNDVAEESLVSLRRDGFEDFVEGERHRFMRIASPMSVICGNTIAAQGAELGKWVIKSFDLLAGHAIADSTD